MMNLPTSDLSLNSALFEENKPQNVAILLKTYLQFSTII